MGGGWGEAYGGDGVAYGLAIIFETEGEAMMLKAARLLRTTPPFSFCVSLSLFDSKRETR